MRYHRRRDEAGALEGRAHQVHRAAQFREAIDASLEAADEAAPSNVAVGFNEVEAGLAHLHDGKRPHRFMRRQAEDPGQKARGLFLVAGVNNGMVKGDGHGCFTLADLSAQCSAQWRTPATATCCGPPDEGNTLAPF